MPRLALIALVLLVTISACGGGGDPLTAGEYRQEAGAICAETQELLDAVSLEGGDVAGYFEETIPIAEDRRDRLDDLEPPEELEEAHDELIDRLDEIIETAGDLRDAAESGDSEGVQEATGRGQELQRELDAAADELGLDSCAS